MKNLKKLFNVKGSIGVILVVLVIFIALFAPLIIPAEYATRMDMRARLSPPPSSQQMHRAAPDISIAAPYHGRASSAESHQPAHRSCSIALDGAADAPLSRKSNPDASIDSQPFANST